MFNVPRPVGAAVQPCVKSGGAMSVVLEAAVSFVVMIPFTKPFLKTYGDNNIKRVRMVGIFLYLVSA